MKRIPRLYRWGSAVFAAAGLALGTPLIASAATASPAATAPAGAGVSTEIVLDAGGYQQCLNDRALSTTPGSPVTIYRCSSALANQWLTYPDNSIRPQGNMHVAVTVSDTGSKLVLEPVSGAPDQQWFFRADGGIESGLSTAGETEFLANSPRQSTANNTQQIVFNQSAVTMNAHWWITKARYAGGSSLSNRPDSAGDGTNWSNDTIQRSSMVVYMGDATAGVHSYQGSVVDNGTFSAISGASTPNQMTHGTKLGDSLAGSISGGTGYSFTSTAFVSAFPAHAYSGSNPSTGDWTKLFFAPGAVANGGLDNDGPVQWAWTYTSARDNCGHTETWVDAGYTSDGQSAGAGNITAPATCPAS